MGFLMFVLGFAWAIMGAYVFLRWFDREVDLVDETAGIVGIFLAAFLWPLFAVACLIRRLGAHQGWWSA